MEKQLPIYRKWLNKMHMPTLWLHNRLCYDLTYSACTKSRSFSLMVFSILVFYIAVTQFFVRTSMGDNTLSYDALSLTINCSLIIAAFSLINLCLTSIDNQFVSPTSDRWSLRTTYAFIFIFYNFALSVSFLSSILSANSKIDFMSYSYIVVAFTTVALNGPLVGVLARGMRPAFPAMFDCLFSLLPFSKTTFSFFDSNLMFRNNILPPSLRDMINHHPHIRLIGIEEKMKNAAYTQSEYRDLPESFRLFVPLSFSMTSTIHMAGESLEALKVTSSPSWLKRTEKEFFQLQQETEEQRHNCVESGIYNYVMDLKHNHNIDEPDAFKMYVNAWRLTPLHFVSHENNDIKVLALRNLA